MEISLSEASGPSSGHIGGYHLGTSMCRQREPNQHTGKQSVLSLVFRMTKSIFVPSLEKAIGLFSFTHVCSDSYTG